MLDLDTLLAGLEAALYPQRWPLTDWLRRPAGGDRSGEPVALPVVWGGYDQTVWFSTTVVLPAPAGRPLVLRLEIPEGLVYLNGRPYQGVDVNHRVVWLPAALEPGTVLEVGVEAYSGRRDDPQTFALAELAVWDAEVHRLIGALQLLRDAPAPAGREVLSAILPLFAEQETDKWRGIVPQALKILHEGREGAEAQPGTVHLIGHSHIDVVWLWRLAETRRKCARTFSTALRLMDHCPTFCFTQSQAQLYALVKADYPDLYREIQAQVAAGRWEVEGAVWVEPDGNLPSGESWVRQLLVGQRFFQREFGVTCRVLWLPDTFGYHGALPQILRQAGVDYFCTTKLNWNDTTVFPLDTFWWEGIDGTRLLSHIPPVGLEGLVRVADLRKSWETYAQQAACPHVLQTYGYGDGGGGPTRDDVVASNLWPHLGIRPAVQVSTVGAFFQTVAETAPDLPVWPGELYLEKHRGTYTTHGWIKQENRRLERALYTAELLASLRAWQTGDWEGYPTAGLAAAWEGVLLNQFHDILPGTFIRDAYADIQATYTEVQAHLDEVITGLAEDHPQPAGRCTVFNALPWRRGDYLTLPLDSQGSELIVSCQGQTLDTQVLPPGDPPQAPGLLVYLPDVPPWGTVTLTPEPTGRPLDPVPIPLQTRILETPYYRVVFSEQGPIQDLWSKPLGRPVLTPGQPGNQFQTFRDVPRQWDAWDVDADYQGQPLDLFQLVAMRVTEQGPLRWAVEQTYTTPQGSRLQQRIYLYHASPRLDFVTTVDWHETQVLLKAAFPIPIEAATATYEIPFGALGRPVGDAVQFEVPAQGWADLSEETWGVALLNTGKYGYDAPPGWLRLTLLRAPHYPHPIEPWHLTDEARIDQGEHYFTYALYPHAGDWRAADLPRQALALHHPLVPQALPSCQVPLEIAGEGLVVAALKKAEDEPALILRLYESHGRPVTGRITFSQPGVDVTLCDLLERPIESVPVTDQSCVLTWRPFEIKSLLLRPAGPTDPMLKS